MATTTTESTTTTSTTTTVVETTEPATTEPATTEPATTAPSENAFEVLGANNAQFAEVVVLADMQAQIESDSVTVFAPPDSAIPPEALTDPVVAADFVDAHVANGVFDAATLAADGEVQMRNGEVVTVNGSTLTSSDGATASITTADQPASNGLVQGISGALFVVVPPTTPTSVQPPTGSAPGS